MKLSSDTISILKNFASINSNIVFREGSTVKTIAEAKNVLASAEVTETFPADFGVYDLSEFLSVMSMFSDPELEFDSEMKYVRIKEGKQSVKYFFSDTETLTSTTKDIKMPSTDLTFDLSVEDISSLRKASSTLGVSDLVISKSETDGKLDVKVTSVSDNTANSFNVQVDVVGELPDEDFSFVFNINNLKLLNSNYRIEISKKLISKFYSSDHESLEYFIALEKTSTFGE